MAVAGTVVLVIAALGSFVPALGLAGGFTLTIALLAWFHIEVRFDPRARRLALAGWWTLAVAVLALRVATSIPLAAPDVALRGELQRPHPDVTTRVRTIPTTSPADMPLVGAVMELAPVTCSVAVWVRADGTVRSAEADACPRLYADAAARVGARFVFEPVPALRSDEVAVTRVGVAFRQWGSTNADAVDAVPRATLFWMSEETGARLLRDQGERVAYVHPDMLDTAGAHAAFERQMGLDGWHYGSVEPLEVRELLDGEYPGAGPRTALEAHTRLHETALPRWVERHLYPYRLDREIASARLLYEALQVEQRVRERDDRDGAHRVWCPEWLADTKGACSARALARWWSVPGQETWHDRRGRRQEVTAATYLEAFLQLSAHFVYRLGPLLQLFAPPAIAFGVWTRWRTAEYRRWLSENRDVLTAPRAQTNPSAFVPELDMTLELVVTWAPTPPSSVRQEQEHLTKAAYTFGQESSELRRSCREAWKAFVRTLDDLPEVRADLGIDTANSRPWSDPAKGPYEAWLKRAESSLELPDVTIDEDPDLKLPPEHTARMHLSGFRSQVNRLEKCVESLRTSRDTLTRACIERGLLTPAGEAE